MRHVKAEAISGVVLVTFAVRFPAYEPASLINKVSKQTHCDSCSPRIWLTIFLVTELTLFRKHCNLRIIRFFPAPNNPPIPCCLRRFDPLLLSEGNWKHTFFRLAIRIYLSHFPTPTPTTSYLSTNDIKRVLCVGALQMITAPRNLSYDGKLSWKLLHGENLCPFRNWACV